MSPLFQQGKIYLGSNAINDAYLGSVYLFSTPAPLGTLQLVINTEGLNPGNTTFNARSSGSGFLYDVDWGDGNTDTNQTINLLPHTYSSPGIYTVTITTEVTYIPLYNNAYDDARQITSVSYGPSGYFPTGTTFERNWYGCTNMTSFGFVDTSSVTTFVNAWRECISLVDFPLIDTSSAISLGEAWKDCTGLVNFPLLNTALVTNVAFAWTNTKIVSFPAISFASCTYFASAWQSSTSLTTFPANMFDTTGTLISSAFNNTFKNCALTAQSIENILTSLDTNGQSNITLGIDGGTNAGQSTWSTAANTAFSNLQSKGWTIAYNPGPLTSTLQYGIDTGASDGSNKTFRVRSTGTVLFDVDWGDGNIQTDQTSNTLSHTYASIGNYSVKITPASGTTHRPYYIFTSDGRQIISVSSTGANFPFGTSLRSAWYGVSNMTSFGLVNTSGVTDFKNAWYQCYKLASFPLIDTSSATILEGVWSYCPFTTFPLIDTSNVQDFNFSWGYTDLTAMPSFDFSSLTRLNAAFKDCHSLTTVGPNLFDSTGTLNTGSAFNNTWLNNALTAQSIENILVSLVTNGQSNCPLNINGGTNAGQSTWSAAANTALATLQSRGWTIAYNS